MNVVILMKNILLIVVQIINNNDISCNIPKSQTIDCSNNLICNDDICLKIKCESKNKKYNFQTKNKKYISETKKCEDKDIFNGIFNDIYDDILLLLINISKIKL